MLFLGEGGGGGFTKNQYIGRLSERGGGGWGVGGGGGGGGGLAKKRG